MADIQSSSISTGAVTFSAAAIQPVIVWLVAGMPQPMPESVSLVLAAALISLIHGLFNTIKSRLSKTETLSVTLPK